jgi:RHS repeat-associated protein
VLSDLQGTTRAVMNNNGSSSAVVARHDHLPFGEEISSALRAAGQGYSASDTNRWRYGMLQRDAATGLDHTWWRKYESFSGRWTSPDPLHGTTGDPQSFNGYSYTTNDPLNFVDPSGLGDEPPPWDPDDVIKIYHSEPYFSGPHSNHNSHGILLEAGGDPQNSDVQKTYSRTFNCNKTNRDIFHRLRTHFPQFANFNGNFGPGGLASASVSFGSGTITKGATIPIHNVDVGPGGSLPTTFDVAVKVATVSTMAGRSMGFSFDTLPGHVLYPASISFFAVQGDQGSVNFSINVNGNFSSTTNKELFNHAGGDDLENKIWNNLIDNVERYCGHEPQ